VPIEPHQFTCYPYNLHAAARVTAGRQQSSAAIAPHILVACEVKGTASAVPVSKFQTEKGAEQQDVDRRGSSTATTTTSASARATAAAARRSRGGLELRTHPTDGERRNRIGAGLRGGGLLDADGLPVGDGPGLTGESLRTTDAVGAVLYRYGCSPRQTCDRVGVRSNGPSNGNTRLRRKGKGSGRNRGVVDVYGDRRRRAKGTKWRCSAERSERDIQLGLSGQSG